MSDEYKCTGINELRIPFYPFHDIIGGLYFGGDVIETPYSQNDVKIHVDVNPFKIPDESIQNLRERIRREEEEKSDQER